VETAIARTLIQGQAAHGDTLIVDAAEGGGFDVLTRGGQEAPQVEEAEGTVV